MDATSVDDSLAADSSVGPTHEAHPQGASRVLTAWEVACVFSSVVVADLTLFRGHGYAGVAAMGGVATGLLWIGKRKIAGAERYRWIVTALLIAAVLKLVWDGSLGLALFGGVLLAALAVALEARPPYLGEILGLGLRVLPRGIAAIASHGYAGAKCPEAAVRGSGLSIVLPLVVVGLFGAIFVMANPDLAEAAGHYADRAWTQVSLALGTFSLWELVFWLFVGLLTLGMLQPLGERSWAFFAPLEAAAERATEPPLAAFRNSLFAVIALFAVYLVFEFRTLWFREFPPGFYYAGYAHQGAAWLTIALGLTTAILSLMFRGPASQADELARLRPLAWIWSLENLVLAAAVYNRMWIYVQFNGMTRMRTVGLLGITAVVVGLLLMLRRLARGHGFLWLVQRYVWVVGLAILGYLLLPVDMLVHRYNVRRVLAGDLPPVVQIVAHPVASEGALILAPLLSSEDPTIREGVRAMLAERHLAIQQDVYRQRAAGWTAFQLSDVWLERHLDSLEPHWAGLVDDSERRQQLIERFRQYAMQWY